MGQVPRYRAGEEPYQEDVVWGLAALVSVCGQTSGNCKWAGPGTTEVPVCLARESQCGSERRMRRSWAERSGFASSWRQGRG